MHHRLDSLPSPIRSHHQLAHEKDLSPMTLYETHINLLHTLLLECSRLNPLSWTVRFMREQVFSLYLTYHDQQCIVEFNTDTFRLHIMHYMGDSLHQNLPLTEAGARQVVEVILGKPVGR